MKSVMFRWALGIILAGGVPSSVLFAEGEVKTLPTLLIKGEVVSLDPSDPATPLLKVKDRYGFETPIYLTSETTISQGDTTLTSTNLTVGTAVEVEYNFDVNTAKRHAVSVKVATPPAAAEAPASTAAPAETTPTSEPAAAPVTPEESEEASPVPQETAPATE